jgi:hypothetical protein
MSLFDLVWFQRSTGSQSDDDFGPNLYEFLEANGCSRTSNSMGTNSEILSVKLEVEDPVLSVPFDFLGFLTHIRDYVASEGISHS